MLQIHNSLTGRKEAFRPLEPGKVRMYVCGITVYDYCHLGHARMLIVFDVVRRHLEASGFDVIYVRNITDIDDKIIQRAGALSEDPVVLGERMAPSSPSTWRASLAVHPTSSRGSRSTSGTSWR